MFGLQVKKLTRLVIALALLMSLLSLLSLSAVSAQTNIVVFVPEQAKVRVGPGTVYDQVGELDHGQSAPAIGRSQYNDWIQIQFIRAPNDQGWVYANLVELRGGQIDQLPIAQTPPTATLPPTPEGDSNPLLATPLPTRLPTYTPAPPVTPASFTNNTTPVVGFPSAIFILGLFGIGVFGAVMAVIRRKA